MKSKGSEKLQMFNAHAATISAFIKLLKCFYIIFVEVHTCICIAIERNAGMPKRLLFKQMFSLTQQQQWLFLLLRSKRIIKTPTTLHHTNAIQTDATFFVDLLIDNLEQLSLPCAPPALSHTYKYTYIIAHTCAYNCILFSFLVY